MGLCLFSFVIATICLSVQTSDLKDEIAKCQKQSEQKPDDNKPSGDDGKKQETPSNIIQDTDQKTSKENPSEASPKETSKSDPAPASAPDSKTP